MSEEITTGSQPLEPARASARTGAGRSLLPRRMGQRIGLLLGIILIATLAMQFISQQSAIKMRGQSELLQQAVEQEDNADALGQAASKFRIAALYLTDIHDDPASEVAARNELTDASIALANALNSLSAAGAPGYLRLRHDPILVDFDKHVSELLGLHSEQGKPGYAAARRRVVANNARLGQVTQAIGQDVIRQRQESLTALARLSRQWHLAVAMVGVLTLLILAALLLDVLRNILPPLRRLHDTLRRLAAGDLDATMPPTGLFELNQLGGALETFRTHARAIADLAFVDPGTGLPNARAFGDQAAALLGDRPADHSGCVVIVDVDRFKYINDEFGHGTADRLLAEIARRISALLPETSVLARIGGDKFAFCLTFTEGMPQPHSVAARIVEAMREPFDLGDCRIGITVSLGHAETSGGESLDVLVSWADLALYSAKHSGRNRSAAFAPELAQERALERAMEQDLTKAIAGGQLRMVYQPIHAVNDANDREVEALVRWRLPTGTEIPPDRFIAAAERSGQMLALGNWIIDRALDDLRAWPHLQLSLNLSPIQIQSPGFVAHLVERCRHFGITANRLVLEVTESLALEKDSRAFVTLELLRRLGFRIALDDFGTGYSSLWLLKEFRFDRLKLDRSLITDLARDPAAHAVFDAAVAMGLRLGAEVVAEGVSEASLVDPLAGSGCTHLQGYHFSRPIEADAVAGYFSGEPELQRQTA